MESLSLSDRGPFRVDYFEESDPHEESGLDGWLVLDAAGRAYSQHESKQDAETEAKTLNAEGAA